MSKLWASPTAVVTGIHGQDGFYLASLLSRRGYRVIGLARPGSQRCSDLEIPNVKVIPFGLPDGERFREILEVYRPREIYNLAARASSTHLYSQPALTAEVNGLAVVRMLEAIRAVDDTIRFCQASSSEIFGTPSESPQTESTPFRPRNPYGIAKLFAHGMVEAFRNHFNIFACSAILYNHESPRRGPEFVTRKVSMAAARIKLGIDSSVTIRNLDANRDWGYAPDYVDAMWRMLQAPAPGDYVVATGESHSVRELCEIAFQHVDLDYRPYVKTDAVESPGTNSWPLVGEAAKARTTLGWRPTVKFKEIIQAMVDADISLAGRLS